MAFAQFKFDKIVTQSRGIFNTYIYETDDSLIDVTTDGYFNACRFNNDLDWEGSIIQCKCSDGLYSLEIINGVVSISSGADFTGWAAYTDTALTEGSPLLLTADNKVNLPNNAGTVLDPQKPPDIATFYDGTVITGRNGDGINITISFAVKPSTSQATRVTTVPDIGGAVGEIEDYAQDFTFGRGSGVEQRYLLSYNAFTLDTWEANGATLKIVASHACAIYNVRYLLTRTHKAR